MADPAPASPAPPTLAERWLLGVCWREAPRLLPGAALAVLVMLAAREAAHALGAALLRAQGVAPEGKGSPVSGITVAVLLGLLVANTAGTARLFAPGLEFAVKKLLRLGIVLVGVKLSFLDALKLGAWGVPVVATVIAVALVVTPWIALRLGLSDRMGALAAASTAICGVTATLAVAPAVEADDREVAYTIANVTIFGMLAMFAYPYLAHALFAAQPGSAGLFLGTAIHDTSQVMGAALSYKEVFHDEAALKVATVTKLTRNVFLAAVVPALALWHARRRGGAARKVRIATLFPAFVLGFLAMAVVRSAGDAGLAGASGLALGSWDKEGWEALTKSAGETWASAALGAAMAGVGLTTRLSTFRGLGLRPLYAGAAAMALVSGLGLALAALVGGSVRL